MHALSTIVHQLGFVYCLVSINCTFAALEKYVCPSKNLKLGSSRKLGAKYLVTELCNANLYLPQNYIQRFHSIKDSEGQPHSAT